MTDSTTKKIFCTGQRLSLLSERTDVKNHLSGERFWRERHVRMDKKQEESPWVAIEREILVQQLTAKGSFQRLAVVCAAGLGKTTNLEWLEYRLAAPRSLQLPIRLRLDKEGDGDELPQSLDKFWHDFLPEKILRVRGNRDFSPPQIRATLERYRTQRRITLLLDSIDQATPRGLRLLIALLHASEWACFPIVVSARPHALFARWKKLLGDHESKWRFVRIEPLEEAERKLLLNEDGHNRYEALPARGRALMANPRNVEYVRAIPIKPSHTVSPGRYREPRELADYTLRDLRTAAHVFAGAAHNLVCRGFAADAARYLNVNKEPPKPPVEVSTDQIEFAHDLLGALAFTMYVFPLSKTQTEPNVSHVPARRITKFYEKVRQRLIAASIKTENYAIGDLEKDVKALSALNNKIHYDLLDNDVHKHETFRWYDRSLQEFYAAWWLARYAADKDVECLRSWRYHDTLEPEKQSLYEPLWGFLVEMPRAVRRNKHWLRAVGVLFEAKSTRCCEMIYRCWRSLRKTEAGRVICDQWQQEFQALLVAEGPSGEVAREIPAGFRRCPKNPDEDGRPFLMGSPASERDRDDDEFQHKVTLSPFMMHRYPVTNAQYKLFDPAHAEVRWGWWSAPPEAEVVRHPVAHVTWYQCWCFAMWTGNHLPTEAQWEYACRGGAVSYQTFHFGNSLSSRDANFDGRYPYGDAKEGPYLQRTSTVGSYGENRFELYDMHGNVLEWCLDWYGENFYRSSRSRRLDPVNGRVASARVPRGGDWRSNGEDCRSASRRRKEPDFLTMAIGFRLAAVPALEPSV